MDGAAALSRSAEAALTDAFSQSDMVILRVAPGFGAGQLVRAWAAKVGSTVEVWRPKSPQPLDTYQGSRPVAVVWTHPDPPLLPPEAMTIAAPQLRLSEEDIAALLPESRREVATEIALQTGGWPALVATALAVVEGGDWYEWEVHIRAAVADRVERHSHARLPARWRSTLDWIACADGVAVREMQDNPLIDRDVVLQAIEMGLLAWRGSGRERAAHLLPYTRYARVNRIRENPVDYAGTLLSISDRRAESGLLDCGLAAAAELEDWPRCARIQDRWWLELLMSSYRPLSDSVIRRLPPHLLRSSTRLSLRAEFTDRFPLGSTPYEVPRNPKEIEQILTSGRGVEVLANTFLGMVGQRVNGNPRKAATVASQAAQLAVLACRGADNGREIASLWFVQAGLSAQLSGDDSTARAHYQMALSVAQYDALGFAQSDAQSKLAAMAAVRGENRVASGLLPAITTENCSPPIALCLDMARRVAEHSLLVDSGADIPLETQLTMLNDPYVYDELWICAFVTVARYLIAESRAHEVLDLAHGLRTLRPVAGRSNGVQPRLLTLTEAEAYLRLGQATQALSRLDSLGTDPVVSVVRSRVLLHAREFEAARFQAVIALGNDTLPPRRRREASLVIAAVAAEADDWETARPLAVTVRDEAEAEGDHRLWDALPERSFAALNEVIGLPRTRIEKATAEELAIIKLTRREKDVLQAMAQGRKQREIAAELFVSINTVKTQQRGLYRKLGAKSGPEALAIASRFGLLDRP